MTGAALFFVPTDFLHSEISRFVAAEVSGILRKVYNPCGVMSF